MLTFVRETSLQIVLQGPRRERRGFLFYMAAGFSKTVDPLSGMSVDLVLVDRWLEAVVEKFSQNFQGDSSLLLNDQLLSWSSQIQFFLESQAAEEGASLRSLRFREARGWEFSWAPELKSGEMYLRIPHFLEVLPQGEDFDLVRVSILWKRVSGCAVDCQREGTLLLKNVSRNDSQSLCQVLEALRGFGFKSGTCLQSLQVEYLHKQYILESPS